MTRNSRITGGFVAAAIAALFSAQYIGSSPHTLAPFSERAASAVPADVIVTGFTAGESNDAAGSPSPTAP